MNTSDPSLSETSVAKLNQTTNCVSDLLHPTKTGVIRHTVKRALSSIGTHAGLFIVVGFVLFGNLAPADAQSGEGVGDVGGLAGFAPEAIGDIVASVNRYTPNINEDRDKVVVAMTMQADNEYLNTPYIFDTKLSSEDVLFANRKKLVIYTVKNGDTLSGIGKKFNLKVATIKITNDLKNEDSIRPGQRLKIPVNDLSNTAIARAERTEAATQTTAYNYSSRSTVARSGSYPANLYFIVPISHNGISRGLSWYHTGIDYRASIGTPVKAAASGKVIGAQGWGWNGGWGKNILVDHGNGRTSRYAHLSTLYVVPGQWVSQGQVIGASGNTGRSTGPHLHFEVRVWGRAIYPF